MRLIDADELKKALAEMWYENNIRITGLSVAELIDEAPTIDPNELELDIDYSIEYDKRPDGISNAKVTITRIKPRNIIACEEVDELDMLERMYAEPSGDLISREEAIEIIASHDETNGTEKVFTGREITDLLATLPSADRKTDESCQDCPLYDTDKHNCPRFNKVIPQTRAEMLADRPKGEWVEDFNFVHRAWRCSKCFAITSTKTPFCHECGADMRKDQDR